MSVVVVAAQNKGRRREGKEVRKKKNVKYLHCLSSSTSRL